jgi:hypothetical protein
MGSAVSESPRSCVSPPRRSSATAGRLAKVRRCCRAGWSAGCAAAACTCSTTRGATER